MTETLNISTANVLHPRQVVELNDTKRKLESILAGPQVIGGIVQDKGHAGRQLTDTDRMLAQAPKAIPADEIDAAVKLETELRERWSGSDMPTHAEMRRNAPGCVDKHRAWDSKYKATVLRWKQIRRRLHASGISEHRQADEGDISNVEMYRPVGGSAEMSLDNAQIPGKIMKLPPAGAALPAVMSEADRAILQEINPELLDRMATFDNEQRASVLDLVRHYATLSSEGEAGAGAAQVRANPVQPKKRGRGRPRKSAKAKESYNNSELAALRAEAKELGINSFAKGKDVLREEIDARKVA